jgi:hypothetical protein
LAKADIPGTSVGQPTEPCLDPYWRAASSRCWWWAAPRDAINATTVLQLSVYTLIPVLPVALATMPLAELSARLLKLVF